MTGDHKKTELYNTDLTDAKWVSAPGTPPEDRIEVVFLPEGAVAMRCPGNPQDTVLFYDAAEWDAFVRGVRAGEFSR